MGRLWVSVLGMAAISSSARTQEVLWDRTGTPGQSWEGFWIRGAGDYNKDGFEDVLTSVSPVRNGGTRPGEVWLLSGRTGAKLATFAAATDYQVIVNVEPAGDLNLDGHQDYAVGVWDGSHRSLDNTVELRDGKTGSVLWSVGEKHSTEFGRYMLGGLNLDGDGKPDLVVSASRIRHPVHSFYMIGAVFAYSSGGKLLWRIEGNLDGLQIGLEVANLGDIDRDGRDDLAVGTSGWTATGYGAAMVVSGRDGKVMFHCQDVDTLGTIGERVTVLGDVDGDSIPDFATSWVGTMLVFSGRTGELRFKSIGGEYYQAISGRGIDIDGDGVGDIVRGSVVAPARDGGVVVYSGRDRTFLHRVPGINSNKLGTGVLALEAPSGSPFGLFAASTPDHGYDPKVMIPLGRIVVFRGQPAGVAAFGGACRGPAAPATGPVIGMRDVGTGFRVHLSDAPAGGLGLLLIGLSRTTLGPVRLPMRLDGFGFPGCELLTSSDVSVLTAIGSVGIDRGYAGLDIRVPLNAAGSLRLHSQWLTVGAAAGAWGWSQALESRH